MAFGRSAGLLIAFMVASWVHQTVHAQSFRVTLSDNLLVLDSQNRSATVDMVNMSEDPMEFSMTVKNEYNGIGADGIPLVRWQPARAMVPASQSVALRVASRLRPDLPAGEYEFRVAAQAVSQRSPISLLPSQNADEPTVMSLVAPLMPSLPITVYLRHNIDKPSVLVMPFVATPEDRDNIGYFPLVKKQPAVSFVGVGQAVRKDNQAEVLGRRIHLTPRQAEGRFSLPRTVKPADPALTGDALCLRIWDQYPGRGKPAQELCG